MMTSSPLYGSQNRRSDYRDRLASQLIAQGSDSSPVQHWSQGAARLAQALAGGMIGMKQDQRADERQKAYTTTMQGAFSAQDPESMAAALAGNADTAPQAMQFRQMSMQQRATQEAEQRRAAGEQQRFDRGLAAQNDQTTAQREFTAQQAQAAREQQTLLAEMNRNATIEAARVRAAGQSGPQGSELERATGILFNPNADTSSPEYQRAHYIASQPRDQYDAATGRMVTIRPELPPNIRPPAYGGQATPQPPMPQGQPPAPGAPQGAPIDTAPNVTVRQIAPPAMSSQDRQKIEAATTDAAVLVGSLNEYVKSFDSATPGERATSVMGVNTPLNTSFSNAALMAKGEALFNLGVLNGPDLDIIRRTLPDPSTAKGQVAGPEGARAAAEQISRMIQDRITSHYRQKGLEPPNMNEYAAGLRNKPAGGDFRSKYGLE